MSKKTSTKEAKTQKKDKNPEVFQDDVELAELKQQLEQAQTAAQDSYDKFVRLQAEMENLRRRTAKDLESAHKFALEKFAKALLEITDSMAMGIKSANEENADVATIKDGIEMTNKLTLDILAKFEITSINPKQGDDLNPELHEAISIIPNPKLKSNTVVEVVQVGWQLSGRVLRPAMVMVAQ